MKYPACRPNVELVRVESVADAGAVAADAEQLQQRRFQLHGQLVVDVRDAAARDRREVVDREHRVVHRRPRADARRVGESTRRRRACCRRRHADRDGGARERRPANAVDLLRVRDAHDRVDERRAVDARCRCVVLHEAEAHERRQRRCQLVAGEQHGRHRAARGAHAVVVERERGVRADDVDRRDRTQLPRQRVRRWRRRRRGRRAGRRRGGRRGRRCRPARPRPSSPLQRERAPVPALRRGARGRCQRDRQRAPQHGQPEKPE